MARNKNNERYTAEWYESDESMQSTTADTSDDELWEGDDYLYSLSKATGMIKGWSKPDSEAYKTCRIREKLPDGNYRLIWQSNLGLGTIEEFVNNIEKVKLALGEAKKAVSSVRNESLKLLIWAHRDAGPPDHWSWRYIMENAFGLDSNQWDLVYGRAVDHSGRKIRWSIRLNVHHGGKHSVARWNWAEAMGFQPGDVEAVRAVTIDPREYPSHVETGQCYQCGKVVPRDTMWTDDEDTFYCSCYCLDNTLDTDTWRMDPSGKEHGGCPSRSHVTTSAA